jgi:hypothetical protein
MCSSTRFITPSTCVFCAMRFCRICCALFTILFSLRISALCLALSGGLSVNSLRLYFEQSTAMKPRNFIKSTVPFPSFHDARNARQKVSRLVLSKANNRRKHSPASNIGHISSTSCADTLMPR